MKKNKVRRSVLIGAILEYVKPTRPHDKVIVKHLLKMSGATEKHIKAFQAWQMGEIERLAARAAKTKPATGPTYPDKKKKRK